MILFNNNLGLGNFGTHKKPFEADTLSHNVCFVPATEAAPFYLWKEASGTECSATSEVCVELQVGTMGKVVQLPRLEKNILTFFFTHQKNLKMWHTLQLRTQVHHGNTAALPADVSPCDWPLPCCWCTG